MIYLFSIYVKSVIVGNIRIKENLKKVDFAFKDQLHNDFISGLMKLSFQEWTWQVQDYNGAVEYYSKNASAANNGATESLRQMHGPAYVSH
ncbi:hypothetical protein L6452_28605 [Arctium lappa]|uniref:Uncharacterized protein n=1 Tax=Arctium lappa TaxID=4217 RepID=A0ACB8ZZ50_ARCLA|nr:hypothetical protein L6452_28605 [Arctium lappa]